MSVQLADVLGGNLLDGVKGIIGMFKESPEKKAEFVELCEKNRASFEEKELQANVQLNQIASDNIKVEAASNSKFVSWARPSVIWMGNVVVLWNYCLRPLAGLRYNAQPVSIPSDFWYIWCACVLGYVVARSGQDIINKTVGGSGGAVQLPFGIKMDSKGD